MTTTPPAVAVTLPPTIQLLLSTGEIVTLESHHLRRPDCFLQLMQRDLTTTMDDLPPLPVNITIDQWKKLSEVISGDAIVANLDTFTLQMGLAYGLINSIAEAAYQFHHRAMIQHNIRLNDFLTGRLPIYTSSAAEQAALRPHLPSGIVPIVVLMLDNRVIAIATGDGDLIYLNLHSHSYNPLPGAAEIQPHQPFDSNLVKHQLLFGNCPQLGDYTPPTALDQLFEDASIDLNQGLHSGYSSLEFNDEGDLKFWGESIEASRAFSRDPRLILRAAAARYQTLDDDVSLGQLRYQDYQHLLTPAISTIPLEPTKVMELVREHITEITDWVKDRQIDTETIDWRHSCNRDTYCVNVYPFNLVHCLIKCD
jgi:hypothetical protein